MAAPLATTQPELSLLAVQVVRNDLSDADEPAPRSRLKGRQLLGRAFPRATPAALPADDELPVETAPPQPVGAGQVKLF